jgi:Amt family ammonium transporter
MPPQLLLGKQAHEVLPAAAAERFERAAAQVRRSGDTVAIDYELTAGGRQRWYEARLRALPGDELLVIVRDVTRRKGAEQELARERALLQQILASMAEGVVVADAVGTVILANPAAEKLFGAHVVGMRRDDWRNDGSYLRADGRPFGLEEWPLTRALRGESTDDVEMLIRRSGQRETWLRFTGRPLRRHGETDGAFVVAHDISEMRLYQRRLESLNSELKVQSLTDSLTGLPNRRAFDRRITEALAHPGRRRRLAVLLLDLDAFKPYNDRFGHAAGDDALRITARVLEKQLRGDDMVARLGGEEFGAILQGAGRREALAIAERCRAAMEAAPWPLRSVTVSIGAALLEPLLDAKTLLLRADQALYAAKRAGRNRVVLAPAAERATAQRAKSPRSASTARGKKARTKRR